VIAETSKEGEEVLKNLKMVLESRAAIYRFEAKEVGKIKLIRK
jgi:hypothetical protein